MSIELIPLRGYLVRPDPVETMIGSIHTATQDQPRPSSGVIITSPEDGSLHANTHIAFAPYSGHRYAVNGEELIVMQESEILCFFSGDHPDD